MGRRKNAAAVALGRKGGLVGGRSKSAAKLDACRANLSTARKARWPKPTCGAQ